MITIPTKIVPAHPTSSKYFFPNMDMIVNTDKAKIMIIKYKKDTYANFIYDSRNLESDFLQVSWD